MKTLVNISSELVPELARKINCRNYIIHIMHHFLPFSVAHFASRIFQVAANCRQTAVFEEADHCPTAPGGKRAGASVQSFQRVHDMYRERDLTKHDIDPCQKFRIFISGLFLWCLPSCQTNAERLLHDRVCAAACSSQIWEHCKYLGRFVVQPRIWTDL